MQKNFKQLLTKVTAFVFDVDGVLTDGSLILTTDGEQVRTMNIKDGYALRLAIDKGYKVVVISGGKSEAVIKQLDYLGVKDVFWGVQNKKEVLDKFIVTHALKPETILCMGDDLPDYELMKHCGVPTCPIDAVNEIKSLAIFISEKKGGQGCVRDVIEQVLKAQGKWIF